MQLPHRPHRGPSRLALNEEEAEIERLDHQVQVCEVLPGRGRKGGRGFFHPAALSLSAILMDQFRSLRRRRSWLEVGFVGCSMLASPAQAGARRFARAEIPRVGEETTQGSLSSVCCFQQDFQVTIFCTYEEQKRSARSSRHSIFVCHPVSCLFTSSSSTGVVERACLCCSAELRRHTGKKHSFPSYVNLRVEVAAGVALLFRVFGRRGPKISGVSYAAHNVHTTRAAITPEQCTQSSPSRPFCPSCSLLLLSPPTHLSLAVAGHGLAFRRAAHSFPAAPPRRTTTISEI